MVMWRDSRNRWTTRYLHRSSEDNVSALLVRHHFDLALAARPLADNEAQACHFIISHQYSVVGIRECIYGTTISALNPGHRLSVVEHKFSLSHSFFIEYANLRIFVIKVEKLVTDNAFQVSALG